MPQPQQTPETPGGLARFFVPILAGATLRERLIACLGALAGIALTALACRLALGGSDRLPFIVAPLGASAVLLFTVPASPLAQPWPIVGGNTISALVGVLVSHAIPDPALAMGVAVALAILAMSFARCLHPPGGAAAMTAVIGGPAVSAAGFLFPFVPVALNSILLVLLGVTFHRLTRRAYPHRPVAPAANTHGTKDLPAQTRVGVRRQDVDAALAAMHETFDIDRGDLDTLLGEVERQALLRQHGALSCADIMSRDVVSIAPEAATDDARALLLEHNIRTLPVTAGDGTLMGTVGLRELTVPAAHVADVLSPAVTTAPDQPAFSLLPLLTNGRNHAVVVTDADRKVLGMITQTDLLAAAARALSL